MLPAGFVADPQDAKEKGRIENISPGLIYTYESTSALINTVGKENKTVEWEFYYKVESEWKKIPGTQTTQHIIYRVIGEPQAPFAARPLPAGRQRPWVAVLHKSCEVAKDKNNASAVERAIIEGIYNQQIRDLTYAGKNDERGYPNYSTVTTFDLTNFIMGKDGVGRPPNGYINCTDGANISVIFSNILGINLSVYLIEHSVNDRFTLRRTNPIGYKAFYDSPFSDIYGQGTNGVAGYFAFHRVTIKGANEISDSILQFKETDPVVPVGWPKLTYFDALSDEIGLEGDNEGKNKIE